MEYQTIRIKSSAQTLIKQKSLFLKNKYNDKLFSILKVYSKINRINDKLKVEDVFLFEMIKKDINNPFILRNCGLLNLPINLSGKKYIETDYIEPVWLGKQMPFFVLIFKPYILLNDISDENELKIIEPGRLKTYQNGKPVKIYSITLPEDYEVLNESLIEI